VTTLRLPHTQPETSLDARVLAERLSTADPEDVITYDELAALIGKDVQHKRRDLLDTARNLVLREHHKTFGTVTNVGIKCLSSTAIVSLGEQARSRLRRASGKTLKRLACATLEELPPLEVHRLLAYTSVLGAVHALTHFATVKRAQQLQETAAPLPLNPAHYKDLFG
jgi:hypothetical protein